MSTSHHHETSAPVQNPCCHPHKKWYQDRLFQLAALGTAVMLSGVFFAPMAPLTDAFLYFLKMIWWAAGIGFILGGIIDYYLPHDYVRYYLARKKKRTILFSVGLGFILSACSHGILALAIELYKKGASMASVVAILMAAPWANFPITILLVALFGLQGLYVIGFAIIVAIISGLIFQVLETRGLIETHPPAPDVEPISFWDDARARFKSRKFDLMTDVRGISKGAWDLMTMVLWWMMIGITLASIAHTFVPHHWFVQFMGPDALGMGVTLGLATIIEVCSEGSAPIALEIYEKTQLFSHVFLFLMAGVATDYTEIGLVWKNIGKKAAIAIPLVTVPQIIFFAWIISLLP